MLKDGQDDPKGNIIAQIAQWVTILTGLGGVADIAERAWRIVEVDMRLFLELVLLVIFLVSAWIFTREKYRQWKIKEFELHEQIEAVRIGLRLLRDDMKTEVSNLEANLKTYVQSQITNYDHNLQGTLGQLVRGIHEKIDQINK